MSICVVCTKGSDYARKISSPTKVLPLPPRPLLLHPSTLQILLIDLLPPPPPPIYTPAYSLTPQILLIGLAPSPSCPYLPPCVLPDPTDSADRPSSLTLLPLSSTQYSLLVSITETALATGF